jgi:hypothetical protein
MVIIYKKSKEQIDKVILYFFNLNLTMENLSVMDKEMHKVLDLHWLVVKIRGQLAFLGHMYQIDNRVF